MIKAIETQYQGYRFRSAETPMQPQKAMSARADRAGKRFGRLTVIECLGIASAGYRWWGCICDCGAKVAVRSRELDRGHTQSCGCLQAESRSTYGGRAGRNVLTAGESAFNQLFGAYAKSARERGYVFELSKSEFRSLTSQPCHYCGADPELKYHAAKGTNGHYYGNGVDRIDNSLGYVQGNVRPCCKQCNISKGVLSEQDFLVWIERVAARFEHGEHGTRRHR